MPFTKKQWNKSMENDPDKYYYKNEDNFYNDCNYNPIPIETLQTKPHFIGIDTETYNENGNLLVLCNSETDSILLRENNDKDQYSIFDYYRYFSSCSKDLRSTVFVCWNLKFDASIILKSLPEKELKKLDEEGETKYGDLRIDYIPKKCLTLSRKRKTVKIYDAMQFYISSLDDAAKTYLEEHKKYEGLYQDEKFPNYIEKDELKLIADYCQLDCSLTVQLMNMWVEKFHDSFHFYPKQYYSVGSIAVTYVKTQLNDMPVFKCASYEVQEMAYACYYGGHFEIYSRGKHEDVYHYDINSAYPYAMVKMPDFLNGTWIEIRSYDAYLKHRKNIGFYKVHCIISEDRVAPFLFRNAENLINCPAGEFITHTTSMELDVALEHYGVEIKFIQGFAFVPAKKQNSEFGHLIENMYQTRLEQKDPLQKTVYKFLINSLYGKFAQSRPKPRGMFSPICCSYITGYCRAMLLDAIKEYKQDIIMLATDGIFSQKPLPVDTSGEKILGNWEADFHPKFYLVMAGIYSYNTIDNPVMESKSRGFGLTTYNPETGKKEKFDFLDATIHFENNHFIFKIIAQRPLSIKHSLIQNNVNPTMIGRMQILPKEINLNGDKKRSWFEPLNSLDDYSDSTTIELYP
jgi:hypothetical protein